MPDEKKQRDDQTAPLTKGKAEGERNKTKGGDTRATDRISSKTGNVTVGKTPGKAEGTRENVDASLKKQEQKKRGGGEKKRK